MRGNTLHVRAFALLLPLLLTGCVHRSKQAQVQPPLAPPIEDQPPSKPNNAPANLPPPVITVPQQQPAPVQPAATAKKEEPPKPAHRRRKPRPAPAPANNEQAANGVAEVSAIGQLSSGEPADVGKETSASIADTEHRLDQIKRKFSEQEQKTSAQIREFLKQAKAALASGDTDGAYTLALKAKVLLGELTK